MILRPDKGNGVVILDRQEYDKGLFKIINDTTKFRVLTSDPTLTREGKLQRYLRELRKKGHFDPEVYEAIYPSGSSLLGSMVSLRCTNHERQIPPHHFGP